MWLHGAVDRCARDGNRAQSNGAPCGSAKANHRDVIPEAAAGGYRESINTIAGTFCNIRVASISALPRVGRGDTSPGLSVEQVHAQTRPIEFGLPTGVEEWRSAMATSRR